MQFERGDLVALNRSAKGRSAGEVGLLLRTCGFADDKAMVRMPDGETIKVPLDRLTRLARVD